MPWNVQSTLQSHVHAAITINKQHESTFLVCTGHKLTVLIRNVVMLSVHFQ